MNSHSSLQSMLTICDQYASKHHYNSTERKCMFLPNNKSMKQFPNNFKNVKIEFIKVHVCCLLGLNISTDIQNRKIESTIQACDKFI